MAVQQLDEFLERLRAERRALDGEPSSSAPPEPEGPLWRKLRICEPPDYARRRFSVDEARALIRTRIEEYLAMPSPSHVLLVRAAAGVGKTTIGVETAEAVAARGKRVAYVAPRHDFWNDVMAIARRPEWWYEWQPRQEGDELRPRTCEYPEEITTWINRGYQAIDFCAGVCGWDYVNGRCIWHAQKRRPEPIVFVQHQHVAGGHPLEFAVAIGDENPLQAFLRQWDIPAARVLPRGMDDAEPLKEILLRLAGLCAGDLVHGPALIEQLGGAAHVAEACRDFVVPAEALAQADIHSASEAEWVDHFHLPQLVPLLLREAEAAGASRDYPRRLIAGKGDLTLLLRRPVDERLPRHVIWLDATGNEHIYAELFGRPVEVVDAQPDLAGRIHVVVDRANGKSDFKAEQAAQLVRAIVDREGYTRPAVVTFQGVKEKVADPQWLTAHFYGARGTNRLEECDSLFVAGTPMPARLALERIAAQVYFRRDRAFADLWTDRHIAYNHVAADGQGREYPAGGYWSDDDLQALVWQLREAEIIQSVHRARPVHRAVDIWLLSNLPIPELPVARLVTAAEIMGGKPDTVRSLYDWAALQEFIVGRTTVSPRDIKYGLDVKWETARRYWQLLIESGEWEVSESALAEKRRGRPSLTIKRITSVST